MDDFDTPGLPIVPSTWITFGDILRMQFEIKELIPFSVPLGQAISGDFPLQKPKQSLPSAIQFTLFLCASSAIYLGIS